MVIDFHTHVFPDKIADITISTLSKNGGIPAHSNGKLEGLVCSMENGGVDISVNLPVVTSPRQMDSIFNFAKGINEGICAQGKVISFCGIHPGVENCEEWLEKIKASGFLGVKVHPDYQGTFFDDPSYIRIFKKAKELGLITVTHAGFDGAYVGQEIKCTPVRVLRALDMLGGYDKLVLAHLGGNELYDQVYNELAGENVYLDTSYVLPFLTREQFEKMVEKHGENKILFATDSPWQDQGEMVRILKSYNLGKAENKILCENAKKLLKIGSVTSPD